MSAVFVNYQIGRYFSNTEGSKKTPKGTKGAHFLTHTLRPCSCSLRKATRLNFQAITRNRLTARAAWPDTGHVPEKEGTGFGDSNLTMADNRLRRSFFVQSTVPPMGGSGGDTFGYAGFRCHRFANPATCRSPRLATGRAVLQPTTEDTMSSFNTPVLSPSAFTRRIDGIDVSQLLRDIGEATACTDPVELFRLCLGAQRVLALAHNVIAGGAA